LHNYIDLFSGCGGFSYALHSFRDDFKCVLASDIETKDFFETNFLCNEFIEDVCDIDPADAKYRNVTLITAGFPCQPWSQVSNVRKGFTDDTRGLVILEVFSLMEEARPRFVLLENVPGLVSHNKGESFKTLQEFIEGLGYKFKYKVLNANDFGLFQNRPRIYIVCFRYQDDYNKFSFPTGWEQEGKLFWDVLEENHPDESLYQTNMESPSIKKMVEQITKPETVYQYRRFYVRENMSGECPALTANMGTGGHNVPLILDGGRVRKLSPRECFRIQGYPDTFILPNLAKSRLYKVAGNTIPVNVVQEILKEIIKCLPQT
jgi:DNA (cytosine-5)-methyltransferase 1